MRILVTSDSHRSVTCLRRILELHSEADLLVFLGDGLSDLDLVKSAFGEKPIVTVRGNNDFYDQSPDETAFTADGKTVFCAHGHTRYVKYGLSELLSAAAERKAEIVLYGHTHAPFVGYEDGVHILCPGAVCAGDYGIVDITKAGVVCFTASVF